MRINYKSDFELLYTLTDVEGNPMSVPTNAWELWLSVGNPLGGNVRKYVAKYDGGSYENCEVRDDVIVVYADNHKLPCGKLWATFVDYQPNLDFADGDKRIYTPQPTDIELVSGAGDAPTEEDVEMVRNYVKVEYDDAALSARITAVEEAVEELPELLLSIEAFGYGDYNGTKRAYIRGKNKMYGVPYGYNYHDDLMVRIISGDFNPATDYAVILCYGARRTRLGNKISGYLKKTKHGWTPLTYGGRQPLPVTTRMTSVHASAGNYWVKAFSQFGDPDPVQFGRMIEDDKISVEEDGGKVRLKLAHIGKTKVAEATAESETATATARYGIAIYRTTFNGSRDVTRRISNIAPFNVVAMVDFEANVWIRLR